MSDKNHFVGREEMLASIGVDLKNLGFVGLTLDPLPVSKVFLDSLITDKDYVYSPEGDYRSWVKGPVGEKSAHVTAKYGLLTPAHEHKDIINELLEWPRDVSVTVQNIEIFPSPYPDLQYGCLVARVGGEGLRDMNAALSVLPHVDSFSEYKPHVTLAYLKLDVAERWGIRAARQWLMGKELQVTGIDYGKELPRSE